MPDNSMTYPQAPIMTAAHISAMRQVVALWPFAAVVPTYLIVEVAQHLEALIAQPEPSVEPDEPEALTFPDLFLKANQHIIDRIVAMKDDEPEATTPSPFPVPSWAEPHLELAGMTPFSGSISVPGPIVTRIKIEDFDLDGTPVTYEGEVTKRIGHDVRTPGSWNDDDDDDDDDEEDDEEDEPDTTALANGGPVAVVDATPRETIEVWTRGPAYWEPLSPDWRREYARLNDEDYQSDQ